MPLIPNASYMYMYIITYIYTNGTVHNIFTGTAYQDLVGGHRRELDSSLQTYIRQNSLIMPCLSCYLCLKREGQQGPSFHFPRED